MTTHERAVEVDTKLADLWGQEQDAGFTIASGLDSLHSTDGQRSSYVGRRRAWPLSDEDTEASIRAKLSDKTSGWWRTSPGYNGDEPFLIYPGTYASETIGRIDSARARLVTLREEARPLEAEYSANLWPRFFLVQNAGGHVHSSMHCQTTFPTTLWSWLPDLSGLTEEDAVAAEGPRLCSVCYPSAPVEWTLGLPKAPRCEGSGKPPAPGYERYASQPCSVCGRYYPVSRNTGVVRAHKPQEA